MSLNTPPSHKPQISATLMFWCLAEQSFHFRVGAMVPTMMDVVALTGLPWTGETAYAGMSVPDIEYHRPKSAGEAWPGLCSPTLAMTADFVDLAKVLHSGRRVALAPPFLIFTEAYFPDLRYDPPPSPVHDFSTYGSWLSSFPLKEVTFHGCFQIFLGLSSALLATPFPVSCLSKNAR
ncbi:hypothetical protein OIU79_024698 [Salix purpurea]|uniref:Aminotransferase-like plant mobile domain-containing protein n=1 Tax=Salix purpurea TaxID=77065 RepID=A0A9Q0W3F7_SALPP|nr:hypothetical protein OIU79_024698 [Salix purpurea]